MPDQPKSKLTPKAPESREDRLKAALKANMAKRKAQARARSAKAEQDGGSAGPPSTPSVSGSDRKQGD